ncbi:MAG: type II toxin-antitoxin system RelE/ParE family toxin [Sediminibacterium sp.]|jgi:toxin HigB-1
MQVVFKNAALEELYKSGKQKGKPLYSVEVVKSFIKKIDILYGAANSLDIANFRSLHLEALTKEKKYNGMNSIRVNDKYRIIIKFIKGKVNEFKNTVEISEVHELTDYH